MNIFKSETSSDHIEITVLSKAHKALLKVIMVDSVSEHIKMISEIENFLKMNDVKWVELSLSKNPIIPVNSVYYINKYNDNTVCHIEDFKKFYFLNSNNLIKLANVKYKISKNNPNTRDWVVIKSSSVGKKEKYDKIIEELQLVNQQ
jgi:hypothetical protein